MMAEMAAGCRRDTSTIKDNWCLLRLCLAEHYIWHPKSTLLSCLPCVPAQCCCPLLQNVDQLVKDLGPEEVPFQLHYQVADLRALLAATFEKTQKRFNAKWARIHKHMGTSSPGLIGEVWESMQTLLLEKCGLLEAHMVKCYPSVHLTVTEGDIKNMMLAAESNLTSK